MPRLSPEQKAQIKAKLVKTGDGKQALIIDEGLVDVIKMILAAFGITLPPWVMPLIELLIDIIFSDD